MEDDEDDMYAPDDVVEAKTEATHEPEIKNDESVTRVKDEHEVENDEEDEEDNDEEEEEDDDSDIEIVTERKDGAKPEPQVQRTSVMRSNQSAPPKAESPLPATKTSPTPAVKVEATPKSPQPPVKPGSSYPAIHSSTIDLDAKPIHEPSGKSIMDVDMDADFAEDDKPWRRPGVDQSDFFNYGFDEFTWASYCLKQQELRQEAKDQKKQVEDMQTFLGMPPMAGGAAAGAAPAMGSMGGAQDFPPEMQQMMNQMMAQGMDPSQMDFNAFMQMMNPGNVPGGAGGQGFGGPQGQSQQQMGQFGYAGNHAGGANRGRGRGRW